MDLVLKQRLFVYFGVVMKKKACDTRVTETRRVMDIELPQWKWLVHFRNIDFIKPKHNMKKMA